MVRVLSLIQLVKNILVSGQIIRKTARALSRIRMDLVTLATGKMVCLKAKASKPSQMAVNMWDNL